MRLFRWFVLRRLVHEPLRSALTVAGIALGIAVIIAIRLANASSIAGFETALEAVSGRTSLEIVGEGPGVPEDRLAGLLWLREYGDIAPIVEGDVVARMDGRPPDTIRVLGIDILRDRSLRDYALVEWDGGTGEPRTQAILRLLLDPSSAILAAKFAAPRGLTIGSVLRVNAGDRIVPLTVRGLLKDEGPARVLDGHVAIMDIAAAQQTLDRFGRIDRLELRLRSGVTVEAAERAIASRLPDGLVVQQPAQRSRQAERMLAAFHLNLTALSYVALLVGLFLVYNTVSVTVLARRTEIGTLRGLGVTRGRIRMLFLGEAAAFAVVGCAAGVLIGRVLADLSVALTSTTVTTLYIAAAAAPPSLGWRDIGLALAVGIPLSLLAAFVPALEASRVAPIAAIRGGDRAAGRSRVPLRSLGFAILLLAAGGWLATRGPINGLPLPGYGAALAIVFGAACLVPIGLHAAARAIHRPARRWLGVEDWLAVNNLAASVPRLSISVAALSVSVAMMIAIAIMVGSFRDTVVYWIGQTLQADVYVSPGSRSRLAASDTLSPDVVRLAAATPGVAAVDEHRSLEIPFDGLPIRIVGSDLRVQTARGTIVFKAPADPARAVSAAVGSDAVVASESFTIRHDRGVGDDVVLQTSGGPVRFRIAAVSYDYSSDRGVLVMDRATFARHFGDRPPSGVSLYLREGVDPEQTREHILAAAGETHRLQVNTNRGVRTEVLRIFDATFAITYALELVAIVVAILGVSGTLLTLILEREPEFTMLRLVGTSRGQIRRMVVVEAALIGAVSQGLGLAVGVLLSLVLVFVINVQSFGWTIQFHVPVGFLVQSSVLMVVCTALAALYPARRAAALTTGPAE